MPPSYADASHYARHAMLLTIRRLSTRIRYAIAAASCAAEAYACRYAFAAAKHSSRCLRHDIFAGCRRPEAASWLFAAALLAIAEAEADIAKSHCF